MRHYTPFTNWFMKKFKFKMSAEWDFPFRHRSVFAVLLKKVIFLVSQTNIVWWPCDQDFLPYPYSPTVKSLIHVIEEPPAFQGGSYGDFEKCSPPLILVPLPNKWFFGTIRRAPTLSEAISSLGCWRNSSSGSMLIRQLTEVKLLTGFKTYGPGVFSVHWTGCHLSQLH